MRNSQARLKQHAQNSVPPENREFRVGVSMKKVGSGQWVVSSSCLCRSIANSGKKEMYFQKRQEAGGPEVGDRKSEFGDQRSEVGGRRSEIRGRRSEVGGQRSEIRDQRSEIRGRRSEVGDQRSEVRDRRSEVGGRRPEVRGRRSEVR
jgi:hypothetical protein